MEITVCLNKDEFSYLREVIALKRADLREEMGELRRIGEEEEYELAEEGMRCLIAIDKKLAEAMRVVPR